MAITTEFTLQAINAAAGKKGFSSDLLGDLAIIPFDFVQSAAAGDIGSFILLFKDQYPTIPAGRWWFYGALSLLTCDAFGAARTLDFGWDAYVGEDGVAVVADDNGLDDNIDVAAAKTANTLGTSLAAGTGRRQLFSSKTGVNLRFTVAGGTIPAATKVNGHLALVRAA